MGIIIRSGLSDDRASIVILQPGDLLLWKVVPGAPLIDRLIGKGEQLMGDQVGSMAYYHVAFVAANPKNYYSSQPPKIDKFVIPDPFWPNVEIRRIPDLDPIKLSLVFQYAESRRGSWYPFLGVLTAGWLSGNQEFCSQYAEDSFAHYPLLLSNNVRFSTPDAIASSPLALLVDQ